MKYIEKAIKETYPLSKIMGNVIFALRKWAEVRARKASDEEIEEIKVEGTRKVPRLKNEIKNPFIEE